MKSLSLFQQRGPCGDRPRSSGRQRFWHFTCLASSRGSSGCSSTCCTSSNFRAEFWFSMEWGFLYLTYNRGARLITGRQQRFGCRGDGPVERIEYSTTTVGDCAGGNF